MKIHTQALFHTPKSTDELLDMLDFPNGQEKAIAMKAAMWAWNCAAHITNLPDEDVNEE